MASAFWLSSMGLLAPLVCQRDARLPVTHTHITVAIVYPSLELAPVTGSFSLLEDSLLARLTPESRLKSCRRHGRFHRMDAIRGAVRRMEGVRRRRRQAEEEASHDSLACFAA